MNDPGAVSAKMRLGLIGSLVLTAISGAFFWAVSTRYIGPALIDDAFISLRYAAHVAEGLGFVWNPGEPPVQGFTSISWVVQLAWLGPLFPSFEAAASALGRAWGLVAVLAASALFVLLAPSAKRWAFLPAAALAFSPIVHTNAQNGMETTWALALVLGAAMVLASRTVFASVWLPALVLAPLTVFVYLARPDAALFVAVGTLLGVWKGAAAKKRVALVAFGGVLATLLAAHLVWCARTFGDPLPLPVHMKQGLASIYGSRSLINFVYGHWLSFFAYAAVPALCIGLYCARTTRLDERFLRLLGATAVYLLYFLTVLPVMSLQWRYLVPAYGVLVVLGSIALIELVRDVRSGAAHQRVLAWAAIAFFALHPVGTFWEYRREVHDFNRLHAEFGRLGRRLADLAPARPLAAGSEAGQFPYYSGWRFLDFAGLNDAFIARNRFRSPDFAEDYWRYVQQRYGLPDLYFEAKAEFGYASLERRPELASRYVVARERAPRIWVLRDSPHFAELIARLR